jgi:multicomponent Na+:H+ antiporter subunit G
LHAVLDVVVGVLLVLGVLLNLTAAIGLHRFPDVFCRMHAATKPATFGLLCVLLGAALAIGDVSAAAKLGLVAVLQLATNPVGGHMVGRAAWRVGVPVHPDTTVDALDGAPRGA